MQAMLHHWVCSVAFSGALCAVCMFLCPAGRVKFVLQMASACVMVLALFSPFFRLDPGDYASALAAFREESTAVETIDGSAGERLNRLVIERECAEYIWDKAQSSGVTLTAVSVRCEWDSGGYWVPKEAEYTADAPVPTDFLETVTEELGIPKERQSVRETNE